MKDLKSQPKAVFYAKPTGESQLLPEFSKISTKNFLAHLSTLEEVRDHDDDPGVLLPDHPPEPGKGALDGSLRCDVGPRLSEAVDEVGVQVFLLAAVQGVQVAAGHSGSESNPRMVIWKSKRALLFNNKLPRQNSRSSA